MAKVVSAKRPRRSQSVSEETGSDPHEQLGQEANQALAVDGLENGWPVTHPDPTTVAGGASYNAPALEKGLDILELLSEEVDGLSQQQIARNLARSATEIFRMLSVLERRGYLIRRADGTYSLSLKMFELSHRHPPIKKLLSVALPIMEELTRTTRQSAHLAVYHDQRILVVAQADSPEPMGFAVRMGTHYPIRLDRTSARVITAFQVDPLRRNLIEQMIANSEPTVTFDVLSNQLAEIATRGYYEAPSYTTSGITDISCPIFDHRGQVAAALTVPYLKQQFVPVTFEEVLAETQRASRVISEGLGAPTLT